MATNRLLCNLASVGLLVEERIDAKLVGVLVGPARDAVSHGRHPELAPVARSIRLGHTRREVVSGLHDPAPEIPDGYPPDRSARWLRRRGQHLLARGGIDRYLDLRRLVLANRQQSIAGERHPSARAGEQLADQPEGPRVVEARVDPDRK